MPLHRPTTGNQQRQGRGGSNSSSRQQRYTTIGNDADDDHHNNDEDDDITTNHRHHITDNDIDIDDDDDEIVTSNQRRRRRSRLQQQYQVIPSSTTTGNEAMTTTPSIVPPPPPRITSTSSSSTDNVLMDVTILDFTHKRWPVRITSELLSTIRSSSLSTSIPTVYDLKHCGMLIHNIPIVQQRLIYQGKLLSDDAVALSSLGIQPSGSIVHLFPKPRVVVVDTTATTTTNSDTVTNHTTDSMPDGTNNHDTTTTTGAHIPTIVMDQNDIERRNEILVLGHADYVEAVSNVKLFSLMLLIISSIELLNLISLYFHNPNDDDDDMAHQNMYSNHNQQHNYNDPTDPYYSSYGDTNTIPYIQHDDFFTDDDALMNTNSTMNNDIFNNSTNTSSGIYDIPIDPIYKILQTWTPIKYVDMIISIMGIYVSLLGIRASNENCLRTARAYLFGTTFTAIAWILYNYYISFEVDMAVEYDIDHANDGDVYNHTSSSYQNNNYGQNQQHPTDDTIDPNAMTSQEEEQDYAYHEAISAMVLPAMVWCLCIFRAYQFQQLLYEAEVEASQRNTQTDWEHGYTNDTTTTATSTMTPSNGGDVELASFSSSSSTTQQQQQRQQGVGTPPVAAATNAAVMT